MHSIILIGKHTCLLVEDKQNQRFGRMRNRLPYELNDREGAGPSWHYTPTQLDMIVDLHSIECLWHQAKESATSDPDLIFYLPLCTPFWYALLCTVSTDGRTHRLVCYTLLGYCAHSTLPVADAFGLAPRLCRIPPVDAEGGASLRLRMGRVLPGCIAHSSGLWSARLHW